MNLDPLSFVLTQITSTVSNLNKKNYSAGVSEIQHLVSVHGTEAYRHLLRCLFSQVDFSADNRGKDSFQAQYLSQECQSLPAQPDFISLLCDAVDHPSVQQKTLKPSPQLLPQISKVLHLSRVQEVAFSIALLHSSTQETKALSQSFLKQKVQDLLRSYTDAESSGGQSEGLLDISIQVLHLLLSVVVYQTEEFHIPPDLRDKFTHTLRRDFPRDRVPVVLAPLLYPEPQDLDLELLTSEVVNVAAVSALMDPSLAEMLREQGCGASASAEDCQNLVKKMCGSREAITPAAVARALAMMIQVPPQMAGLDRDSLTNEIGSSLWNVENFASAIKELTRMPGQEASSLNWVEVMKELDHPNFVVTSPVSLRLLTWALFRGLDTDHIPLEALLKPWKNMEGQLSFVAQCLRNSDVLCIGEQVSRQVTTDMLKQQSSEEDNKELSTWKSLDLVECLLILGNAGFHQQCLDLCKRPITVCPDVLTLAVLQALPNTWTALKHDLLGLLVPVFLNSHPNSGVVLQQCWNSPSCSTQIRTCIMHCMAEWYLREPHDQARLGRILDISHDLKALSMMLNASCFPFIIDLACLASRREYLKLEKWLSDKVREFNEPFLEELVKFFKHRCPGLSKDESAKAPVLTNDMITTILQTLHNFTSIVTKAPLLNDIKAILQLGSVILRRQMHPAVAAPGTAAMPAMMQQKPRPPIIHPAAPGAEAVGQLAGQLGTSIAGPLGTGTSSLGTSVAPPFPSIPPAQLGASPGKLPPLVHPGLQGMQSLLQQQGVLGLTGLQRGGPLAGLPPMGVSALGLSSTAGHMPTTGSSASLQQQVNMSASASQSQEVGSFFPGSENWTKEVEDESNQNFQRLYSQDPTRKMTVADCLTMLKNFKNSNNQHKKDVFNCMLKNLFEEYKFYPTYPDRELALTADMFGGLIEEGLVTFVLLGVALRYVLEALKKTNSTKHVAFGIRSLDNFKKRLREYPQYCTHVANLPNFGSFPPMLREYVTYGASGHEPPPDVVQQLQATVAPVGAPQPEEPPQVGLPPMSAGLPPMSAANPSTPTPPKSVAGAIGSVGSEQASHHQAPKVASVSSASVEVLLNSMSGDIPQAPMNVQDKVAFIFNNLSISNVKDKAKDVRDLIFPDHLPWASSYLVMKRASIEANFHKLYNTLIDALDIPGFLNILVKETLRNIDVLLGSGKAVNDYSERCLLKNLGRWLGMLTLARNKPILFVQVDLKGLMYEAYQRGSDYLFLIVPFVTKILEACGDSKAFKPPSPWLIGLLNVLAELYHEPGLKLNIKFELEVLCRTLDVAFESLKPTLYLRDASKAPRRLQLLAPPPAASVTTAPPSLENGKLTPTQNAPAPASLLPNSPLPITIPPPASRPPLITMPAAAPPPPPPPSQFELMQGFPPPSVPTPVVPQPNNLTPQPVDNGPHFKWEEINPQDPHNTIMQFARINEQQMPLLQNYPQLKNAVRPAMLQCLHEILLPYVEKATKQALPTATLIAKKDFALDPDEKRLRVGVQSLARHLVSGMTHVHARDGFFLGMQTHLKRLFVQVMGQQANPALGDLVDVTVKQLAADNADLLTAFAVKTACEKVTVEVDNHFAKEYDVRQQARKDNRRYVDPQVLTYQAQNLPEAIRLKVGGPTPSQMKIYEGLGRMVAGFATTQPPQTTGGMIDSPSAAHSPVPSVSNLVHHQPPTPHQANAGGATLEDHINLFDRLIHELEHGMHTLMLQAPHLTTQATFLRNLRDPLVLARNTNDITNFTALLNKVLESLLMGYDSVKVPETENLNRFGDVHIMMIRGLQDHRSLGLQWLVRAIARFLKECRDDYRHNVDGIELLIRRRLVHMQIYDTYLSESMEAGLNYTATTFCMQLVQRFCSEENASATFTEADFKHTIDTLQKIAQHSRQAPDGLTALVQAIRTQHETSLLDRSFAGSDSVMQSGITQAREYDDPPDLHTKVEYLLREWVNLYHSQATGRDNTRAFTAFVSQMGTHGILKTDELITRFFRLCTEMCVDLCYRVLADQSNTSSFIRAKCFHTLDAYVRLIALLVKHSGDQSNAKTKINLLNKVLGIVAGILLQDHEIRRTDFQQMPYHRIFIMLFIELNAPEHVLESINMEILTAFCNVFHVLRPSKAPGFAFAWLELVSHRVFIGRMLAITPGQKCWSMYAQLLIDLFRFLAPFLRNAELGKSHQVLYKGTLRVLLVLLHDFPEFLCDFHYSFCDVLPSNCIQMRNMILSAFPRAMRLPDPFSPNLKVDMLQEVSVPPKVYPNYTQAIQPVSFKNDLDSYLTNRAPVSFLSDLSCNLKADEEQQQGSCYNVSLINALVLYVGSQAIKHIQERNMTPSVSTIAHSSHMDIFQNLAVNLDTEGRYLFLNALVNQLRYPNAHTHYFSCTLLYLFSEANKEAIQEQITRVLLERLIVNRPHPWGLLITFIDLIKNPTFKFWQHEFVHCAPEIEKLFENVARSCNQRPGPREVDAVPVERAVVV